MSSITDKILKDKEAKAKAKVEAPAEVGATGSLAQGAATPSAEDMAQKEKEAQAVAKDAGATETPKVGAVETGVMTSILEQKDMPKKEEIQAQRTEVSTNVDVLNTRLIGGGDNRAGLPEDPPNGTLPNSNLTLENDPKSFMGINETQQAAGLKLGLDRQVDSEGKPKLGDAEAERIEREAEAWADSEGRRQRMLAGRPQDTDLLHSENDGPAPKGGWKATGIFQIALKNGTWFKAVNGYFVPETEEQEDELAFFEKKGLVDKP